MRSLKKALRDVGLIVGTAAATAGVASLGSPEVLGIVGTALGPYGALAVVVLPVVVKALQDKIKHLPKPGDESPEGE